MIVVGAFHQIEPAEGFVWKLAYFKIEAKKLAFFIKEILNESYIGKYVSFKYRDYFYDKAFIIEENGYISMFTDYRYHTVSQYSS